MIVWLSARHQLKIAYLIVPVVSEMCSWGAPLRELPCLRFLRSDRAAPEGQPDSACGVKRQPLIPRRCYANPLRFRQHPRKLDTEQRRVLGHFLASHKRQAGPWQRK